MFFQMLSRNNDASGNPYRLILCYDSNGVVVRAYQERSSSPNIVTVLQKTHKRLPTFHLAPSEYNVTRASFESVLEYIQ